MQALQYLDHPVAMLLLCEQIRLAIGSERCRLTRSAHW
jgi:hypothetical protein